MRMETLLEALPQKTVNGSFDRDIRFITHDSRAVRPGDMFVALREPSGNDGHLFVDAAVANGAVAVVVEHGDAPDITAIHVPDTGAAFARLAASFFGYPAQRLRFVGVTGTNGKTTTTYLIDAMFRAAGYRCGLIGTTGNRFDGAPVSGPQTHTTPYPMALQSLMKDMADRGGQFAVMEVSSHGLALNRLETLFFEVGVFTNLTRDHLDFHTTLDAYVGAKRRLFTERMAAGGTAVINGDDPLANVITKGWTGSRIVYGMGAKTDLRLEEPFRLSPAGVGFTACFNDTRMDVSLPLTGRFNVYNAAAAIGTVLSLGIPMDLLQNAMTNVSVPGRMERVSCGQPFAVLVDYAHTPDALGAVLSSAREWTTGRLVVVFGCGGDRDRGKRPQMGRIASDIADIVIVTSDNPRTEPPMEILKNILEGVPAGVRHQAIVDRRTAIAEALDIARPGDTVLIAGKGHETYQILGVTKIDFDDRVVAREILEARFDDSVRITA
ncbi:MAG: UDP-N-acetylmuramoyl-L-alanyl-D-glutamate--2,6-diaminopimelate ligase [candidate division Zixibacteria bacterium]|nr:UDP-N-acetylmuramoyl-L-alanyl-D-glutamate--2,6-diaminopimelate ligase [candidate division Zixibacteria bacterium]